MKEKILSNLILFITALFLLTGTILILNKIGTKNLIYPEQTAPVANNNIPNNSQNSEQPLPDNSNNQNSNPTPVTPDNPSQPANNQNENPTPITPANSSEIVYGNRGVKQAIFTFDAGAGAQSLSKILSALEKHNVKGTFFITGKWAEQNPESVKKISQAGHEIFNHTYSHPYLTQSSDAEIKQELAKTETIISKITGKTTKPYFRPPYGDRNEYVRQNAAQAGYQSAYWTIDALDWKETEGMTAEQVKDKILNNLKPGTIYLMHIGDNITGEILDEVFTRIKAEGYSLNSLSQGMK